MAQGFISLRPLSFSACALINIVYIIYTMSFIRQIKRKGRVYLAEVENRWIKGKCVQRHLRYVGRQADGQTLVSASLSEAQVQSVKVYGPLLLLHHLAQDIGLPNHLGTYS